MSLLYIRMPHYIASYLRNRDERHTIAKGEPIRIETGDPLMRIINFSLIANINNLVSISCFSESQWRAMQKGQMLTYRKDNFALDISRSPRAPLTLAEIYRLCDRPHLIKYDEEGNPLPDTEYIDEYVPFRLPSTVMRDGRETKVHSDFFLPDPSEFIKELRMRFRMALTRFVALDREIAHSLELKRSKMEALDRFALKYDIRTGDREREQLKKLLNRSIHASLYSFDADEDHGRWSHEHIDDCQRGPKYRCRQVLCETTGDIFPSVTAFGKHIGVKSLCNVFTALKKHSKIHGLYISYLNENS